jgi:hAT family C-terminal dimerisation region
MSVFECLDHILKTKIAMKALLAEENIVLNQEIKNHIIDDNFWEELKTLCDFLELFINFIQKLEGDEPYLSSAFVTLRGIESNITLNDKIPSDLVNYSIERGKFRWNNFLYNPAVMVAYRLDPRFNGELLHGNDWHDIIEEEIIRIAGKENEVQVLYELSEYIGKSGGFAKKHLWSGLNQKPINWWNLLKSRYPLLSSVAIKVLSIPATSAASERNWSTYNFIHSKLRNRMTIDRAEKLVYIYWNIRILRKLEVPLTVKELIKSGVNFSDSDKESDGEQNDDDFEVLTEYEENETDLDIDINEDLVYYEN